MDKDRWNPGPGGSNSRTGKEEEDAFDLFSDIGNEVKEEKAGPHYEQRKAAAPAPAGGGERSRNSRQIRPEERRFGEPEDEQDMTKLFHDTLVQKEPFVSPETENSPREESVRTEPARRRVRPQSPEEEEPARRRVRPQSPEEEEPARRRTRPQPPEEEPARRGTRSWESSPMDSLEEDEDEESDDSVKKLVKILAIVGVSVLVIMLVVVWVFFRHVRKDRKTESSSISTELSSEESVVYDGQEMFGVIESIDPTGQVSVYSAQTASTTVFNLQEAESVTDQYGSEIKPTALQRGQIVQVEYNATDNKVYLFRLTAQATELKNAYGAVIADGVLKLSDISYSVDDHLICLYQGQDYDVGALNMQQVFTAKILDDHVYTIYISRSTGELALQNYDEYIGGTLSVTAGSGETFSAEITEGMANLTVLEGLNTVTITMDSAMVYSAKIFVVGGEVYTMNLPESMQRVGRVTLVTKPTGTTVVIDGTTYAGGETIELPYGQHKLVASASGYSDLEKQITIGQPYQRILLTMTNNVTTVSITSALNGSAVYIDGEYQGTAPVRVELSPGTYDVTLVTEGYKDASMSVKIEAGQLERVIYFSDFTPEESSSEPEPSSSEQPPESSSTEPPSSSDPGSSSEQPSEPSSEQSPTDPGSEPSSDAPPEEAPAGTEEIPG